MLFIIIAFYLLTHLCIGLHVYYLIIIIKYKFSGLELNFWT